VIPNCSRGPSLLRRTGHYFASVLTLLLAGAAVLGQGGGVFPIGAPPLPGLKIGYLSTTLEPPCALSAGAGWWVEGDTNRFTNSLPVAALEYTYTIRFVNVRGFASPTQQTVRVTDKLTNTIVARYRPVEGAALQANIEPVEAITAGARWFIVGDSTTNTSPSGEVRGLGPCAYLVSGTSIQGWRAPTNQPITLSYGRTNVFVLRYLRGPPAPQQIRVVAE